MEGKQLNNGDVFTGYCTKWCLTNGIFCGEFEACCDGYAKQVRGSAFCKIGKDVFTDRAEASVNAKERARRKLVSLKKELAKIEALTLEPKWEAER
jgi:hypothetical protein